ncbi:MAG: bifunctional ADP-dependent NAD(P)H-hydrate dehydratase/NAD(P)H-hydrate epimerase [Anaerolineales bacterium]
MSWPVKLVTVSEMQAIEKAADAAGHSYAAMMEHAGRGLAKIIDETFGYLADDGILGLIGSGNNGGDALVALTYLVENGWKCAALLIRPRSPDDPLLERARAAGIRVLTGGTVSLRDEPPPWRGYAVLLDGVLGTGTRLPLRPEASAWLDAIRADIQNSPEAPLVVAVDVPSGVDCDSGQAAPETIPADLTVTMAAVKAGMLRLPAFSLCGEIRLTGIGLPDDLLPWQALRRYVISPDWVRTLLPPRPSDAHKGTFGTALVVAGSTNYTGAALLAGKAAYRVGAGLVTMGVPAPLHAVLAGHFPEATWLLLPHELGVVAGSAAEVVRDGLARATALLIGPGFGLEETSREFIAGLLAGEASQHVIGFMRRAAPETAGASVSLPQLVVDADGLKHLAKIPDWAQKLPAPAVLTPHPGEMSALTGLPRDEIQADRLGVAARYAAEWGHVVVLKGAHSVVAAPDGRLAVLPVATPALARAGTGDVLAGLITGLRAQGVAAFEAAVAGAWLHAAAGLHALDSVGNAASVLAGDVLAHIPDAINDLL